MPIHIIILHYQDVMIQTQMYNMTLLPILHGIISKLYYSSIHRL
jgi:hypothetical protein